MIDFRYHVVSLMAVLIALTMGVILGAGPLQGPLSQGLSGEVTRITAEKANLKEEIAATQAQITDREKFIEQMGLEAGKDALKGINVAIVEMPGALEKDVTATVKSMQNAGAVITDRVKLTAAWVNQTNSPYRQQLSQSMSQYLATSAPGAASSEQILGLGLIQVLTSANDKNPSIFELFAAKDMPLAQFPTYSNGTAKALVIIGAPTLETPKIATSQNGDDKQKDATKVVVPDAVIGFAQALVANSKQVVIIGDAKNETDLLALTRANSIKITTVDSLGTMMAVQSAPLALASTMQGKIQNYGTGNGANAAIPPLPRGTVPVTPATSPVPSTPATP